MPKYQYTAKDVAGKKKKGQLMAADEAASLRAFKGRKSVFDFLPSGTKGEKKIHIVLLQGSFLSSVGSLELCLAQVFRL